MDYGGVKPCISITMNWMQLTLIPCGSRASLVRQQKFFSHFVQPYSLVYSLISLIVYPARFVTSAKVPHIFSC